MDPRTMPVVTFRCVRPGCGEQVTVERVLYFARRRGKLDVVRPHPLHHHRRMQVVQVRYAVAGESS